MSKNSGMLLVSRFGSLWEPWLLIQPQWSYMENGGVNNYPKELLGDKIKEGTTAARHVT